MKKIKLQRPDTTLAEAWLMDEPIETISQKELKELEEQKVFGDVPAHIIVPVKIYGESGVVVFRNNGQVPIDEGTELDDIVLDNPDFWYIDEIWDKNGNRIDHCWEDCIEFSDDEDALEWEGRIDWEAVESALCLKKSGNSPWADFVGVFYTDLGRDVSIDYFASSNKY